MLLSHEVRSPYRPNNVFRIFIENIRRTGSGPNLLFTSAPRLAAVNGFEDLIAAPTAQPTDHGDVSLTYDGSGWCVVSHAVDASRLT